MGLPVEHFSGRLRSWLLIYRLGSVRGWWTVIRNWHMLLPTVSGEGHDPIGRMVCCDFRCTRHIKGGGVILWWIRKPMVHLTKIEWAGWYDSYTFDVPTDIMLDVGVVLQNTGETGSHSLTGLEPGLGTEYNRATWKEGNQELLTVEVS